MNADQKFFKLKMVRKESNHKNLRTDEIEGYCASLPLLGDNFILLSKGLEQGVRVVRTTPVTHIEENSFSTVNSVYSFDILQENVDASVVENYLYNLSDPSVN
jgi:hypothetical protein